MSADPKSLATLAITTTNSKIKNKNASSDTSSSGHNATNTTSVDFRSTDEFIAGCAAAFVNTSLLFPINKLIFRQMAGGHRTQVAADQMKKEGFRYLYRGILPPLVQKMASVSIMFGSFEYYRKWADNEFKGSPKVVNLALASCLTGATEAILTPLERVQMLLQDRNYHSKYKNTMDALIKLKQFGSAEYYRGLTCVLVRNGPSNILFFGLRDKIKKLLPNRHKQSTESPDGNTDNNLTIASQQHEHTVGQYPFYEDSMFQDFLSGAILGMCISTLFYPLSVVRTRMQTRAPGTEFLSIVKAYKAVYSEREKKFTRLFHGCLINVMRQFFSWGIINCCYEFVLDCLHSDDDEDYNQ